MTMPVTTIKPFAYSLYLNASLQAPRFLSPFPLSSPPSSSPSSTSSPLPEEWGATELTLINNLLNGQLMPGFDALARYIFHSVTGQSLGQVPAPSTEGFIGETSVFRVHLLYHSNRSWLRSKKAILNASQAAQIEQANTDNKHCVVFAAARFMNSQILAQKHIEFYHLPYALNQVTNAGTRQITRPSPASLPQFLHRDGNGWRELDYERDILGHLDWHILHFRETAAFASCLQRQGCNYQKNWANKAETELSSAFQVWRLLDIIPNPWQGARLLEEALALLSDHGFSEAELFAARPALVHAILDDVRHQVATQADALFQRKLAMAEIRQRTLQQ